MTISQSRAENALSQMLDEINQAFGLTKKCLMGCLEGDVLDDLTASKAWYLCLHVMTINSADYSVEDWKNSKFTVTKKLKRTL